MGQRTYETVGTSALKLVQTRDLRLAYSRRNKPARQIVDVRKKRANKQEKSDHTFFTGVACLFIVLAAIALILASELASRRVANAVQERGMEVVSVEPGDTLWAIAHRHAVDGCSAVEIVQWVEEHNGLSGACIVVGQQLEVPCAERIG